MTIQEIERVCNRSEEVDFSRHELQTENLLHKKQFFPLGFPIEVSTNSRDTFDLLNEMWGSFESQHDTPPIHCEVHVVKAKEVECPPAPTYRIMPPLLISVADGDNYSIVDFKKNTTMISVSESALRYRQYASYFLLTSPLSCIASSYATPVHAACVAMNGRGMLLCGDSGAGKSTLSYACARAGWSYTSDDGSFLLNGGTDRVVTGNCHQIRFRPTAATLFPEIAGREITPRAAGKPSIELPTAPMTNIRTLQTTRVDFIVFLNRRLANPPRLVPYRRDIARQFMRQALYGSAESLVEQYAAIERLLVADVFELRYSELDWAVDRLRTLACEGR